MFTAWTPKSNKIFFCSVIKSGVVFLYCNNVFLGNTRHLHRLASCADVGVIGKESRNEKQMRRKRDNRYQPKPELERLIKEKIVPNFD